MRKNKKRDWLLVCLYLSFFFPFVSPYPIQTDLQPVFIFFAVAIIFLRGFNASDRDGVLILVGILSFFYLNPFVDNLMPYKGLGAFLSIPLAVLNLVIFTRTFQLQTFIWALEKSIIIYFVFSILFYIFPTQFADYQLYIVRNVNTLNEGISYRGISTFSTEPGFFGAHLVALTVILYIIFDNGFISARKFIVLGGMASFIVILSKSGMGYSYLILALIITQVKNIRSYKGPLIAVVGSLILYLLLNFSSESNRGLSALVSLNRFTQMEDNSILTRIYNVITGFYVVKEYPFGFGFNHTGEKLNEIIVSNQFLRQYYGPMTGNGFIFGFTSSLALLLSYYGLNVVVFLIYLIRRFKPALVCLIFSLLFLTFSFSAAYPMIWILMTLSAVIRDHEYTRKRRLQSSSRLPRSS